MTRNLVSDRPTFDLIGTKECRVSPAFDDASHHPRQVHGVGNARIHAVTGKRHPDVRGIATQEDAPIAETVGNHASSSPILLTKNFERERRSYTEDLADAAIAVDSRQEVVDQPPLATVDREHQAPRPRIQALDRPGPAWHHPEQIRCVDVGGLHLYHSRIAAQPNADLVPYVGMGAVAADHVARGDLKAFTRVEVLGDRQDAVLALLEIEHASAVQDAQSRRCRRTCKQHWLKIDLIDAMRRLRRWPPGVGTIFCPITL